MLPAGGHRTFVEQPERTLTAVPDRTARALTTVFLLDAEPVRRAGLRAVLRTSESLRVIGGRGAADGALAQISVLRPDVVLVGAGRSLGTELDAVRRLRAGTTSRQPKVILLRSVHDAQEADRVLRAGAHGCLPPRVEPEQLVRAVALVAAGAAVFLPLPAPAPEPPSSEPSPARAGLTQRERGVLALLARGLTNAEIADELLLAEATVKKYVTHAMRKIGKPNRLSAGLYAYRHGLAG